MLAAEIKVISDEEGGDKADPHAYEHLYSLIHPLVLSVSCTLEKPCILEIGYHEGAGARTFARIFPGMTIYGLDKTFNGQWPDCCQIVTADTGNFDTLERVAGLLPIGQFALIVDDGSHIPEHQANAHRAFWDLLAPGGLYVIEDIQDPKHLPYLTVPGMLVDLRVYKGQYDDIVILLRHP